MNENWPEFPGDDHEPPDPWPDHHEPPETGWPEHHEPGDAGWPEHHEPPPDDGHGHDDGGLWDVPPAPEHDTDHPYWSTEDAGHPGYAGEPNGHPGDADIPGADYAGHEVAEPVAHAGAHVGADPDAYADPLPDTEFPPALDVGPLPEPVDGFPWIDAAGLGDAGPVEPHLDAVDPHDLAGYAGVDLPPDADPWAVLAASQDPAAAALARWWADQSPTG